MRRPRTTVSGESGAVLLETAIVIPVALIFLVGVIDLGRAFNTLATAQKSVRGAVRYLTTVPTSGVCPTTGASPAWGVVRAKNLALYGNVDGSGAIRIPGWTDTKLTVTSSACPVVEGATIHIKASVPFTAIAWTYIGLPQTMNMVVDYEAKWIGQ